MSENLEVKIENTKTIKQILVDNAIYGSTAINKKINVLKDYLEKEQKEYDITTTNIVEIIEMLNIVLATAKGKPKEKLLILLSEYGYEVDPATIETKPNKIQEIIPADTHKRLSMIDSQPLTTVYDITELLKEIDAHAKEKIDKRKK